MDIAVSLAHSLLDILNAALLDLTTAVSALSLPGHVVFLLFLFCLF